jgi:hypothetical protein
MAYTVDVNTRQLIGVSDGMSERLYLNIFKHNCIRDKIVYALTEILLLPQCKDITFLLFVDGVHLCLINYV